MYSYVLILHSIVRWFALGMLIYSLYRAYIGYRYKKVFSKHDHLIRHWTATTLHIQLLIGFLLYIKSPIVYQFWHGKNSTIELFVFSILHFAGMFSAILLVTVGSALAKRKTNDLDKYQTILVWFGLALLLILLFIPWPFSPFAPRPYYRS